MGSEMAAARLISLLPRLLALVVIWLLGWSTYTLAAETSPTATETAAPAQPTDSARFLRVPDVRNKAYVFAKGILLDAGFAWRVEGSVQGYAVNTVVGQTPAPGTRVLDNGEPTVALALERNGKYAERGLPENEAPLEGEPVVTALAYWAEQRKKKEAEPALTTTEPAPVPEPATTTEPAPEAPAPPETAETREPDFVVEGAQPEPADELPLPERAHRLERYLKDKKPSDRVVNHWLYQHSWIVTGALWGWHDGAEALRILIGIDENLQRRWDIGVRSERIARRALAEVLQRTK
jgi:hypothetical protein